MLDVVGGCASTHIIVKFAPATARRVTAEIALPGRAKHRARAGRHRTAPAMGSAALTDTWHACGATGMRPLFPPPYADAAAAARHGLDRTYIVEVPFGSDTPSIAASFAALGGEVESAGVDPIVSVARILPDDPRFCDQYGLQNTGQTCSGVCTGQVCTAGTAERVCSTRVCTADDDCRVLGTPGADVRASQAWDIHTGDPGTVTIAVIDSGIHPHADLIDRLVPGWNVAEDNADTRDACPHGTHVAGIAAATGNNGVGVTGLSWGASLMPVRVFAGFRPCSGTLSTVALGVVWAVDHGADICNLSIQSDIDEPALEDAVNYAWDIGVLVVSAAGNTCTPVRSIQFPARYANSMAVGATDADDLRAAFSQVGAELDVTAPGDRILSTSTLLQCDAGPAQGNSCIVDSECQGARCVGTVDSLEYLSGTSQATPLVSGLAALLKSMVPTLTPIDLRRLITTTVDDLGPPGWDPEYGFGRINAGAALLKAQQLPQIFAAIPADGSIDARQPFEPDGSEPMGWLSVDLDFLGAATPPPAGEFSITAGGVSETPLVVLAVGPLARVIFPQAIPVEMWTTIEHTPSATSVRLGYLPGDVNGDGVTSAEDVATLLDALRGGGALPESSVDIDRSGRLAPADILRQIDLLNGAEAYSVLGGTLP
ncbi:MAG: S8 family serine peptidase [Phycisphaerae bacterium]